MKKSILFRLVLLLALAVPLAVPAHGHSVYAKVGFLGAGLGYGHRISDYFALRADATTIGAFEHSGNFDLLQYRQWHYDAKFKAHQLGLYGDWFPFGNGLRVSAGLHLRRLYADLQASPNQDKLCVGRICVPRQPGDKLTARVDFPALAPYLGRGGGGGRAGWRVLLDAGVAFGRPRASLDISPSLRAKLALIAILKRDGTLVREVEAERQKLLKRAKKITFFPHLYVGVAYRF